MNCRAVVKPVLVLAAMMMPSISSYAAGVNALTLWTRKTGSYSDDQNPAKQAPLTVDFAHTKLKRHRAFDAQYGRDVTYRGVFLADVLKLYRPQAHDDLAILHFDNGMAIPVATAADSLAPLNAFIALEICASKAPCTANFPPIAKEDVYALSDDPRPIAFSWNKLAVSSLTHPEVPETRQHIFSPWHHADTLSGIEFVNSDAYYRQFAIGEADGQRVFRERCQFCHGARFVGAKFGWDFVTPLPLFEKRPPEQLLNHVKYPKVQAKTMGLMMPAQPDVTADEMKAIWRWMRKAAQRPLPPYKPQ